MKLDKKLQRLDEIKSQVAQLEAERKELESELIEHLESVSLVSTEWGSDRQHKVTVVYSSSIVIDEDGLREELSDTQWRSITKRVIDDKLLEDKVARGQIDVEIVARHTTEKPRKPYLRLTKGK